MPSKKWKRQENQNKNKQRHSLALTCSDTLLWEVLQFSWQSFRLLWILCSMHQPSCLLIFSSASSSMELSLDQPQQFPIFFPTSPLIKSKEKTWLLSALLSFSYFLSPWFSSGIQMGMLLTSNQTLQSSSPSSWSPSS